MSRPNVLRRCTVCKKYGAPFLVIEPSGKFYYCYECWKVKFAAQPPPESDQDEERPGEQAEAKRHPAPDPSDL